MIASIKLHRSNMIIIDIGSDSQAFSRIIYECCMG